MARSTARKRALNTLYEADEKDADILDLLDERIKMPGAQTPLPDYAIQIVRGVADHYKHIDGLINDHASWRMSRMAVIDRNILRLATWEIVYNDDTPDGVAIDEAIQLSKKLSDADSPAFIHAVLSAIAADPNSHPEGDDESQRSTGPRPKRSARHEEAAGNGKESASVNRTDGSGKPDESVLGWETEKTGTSLSLIPSAERRRRRAITLLSRRRELLRRREGAPLERPTSPGIHRAERLLARTTIRLRAREK